MPLLWDALPHNVIVDSDGAMHFIDEEWGFDGSSRDAVLARGALLTGQHLARNTRPSLWPACETTRDLVLHIGSLIGLSDDWIGATIAREATFQVAVEGVGSTVAERDAAAELRVDGLHRELDQRLDANPLAPGREKSYLPSQIAELQERSQLATQLEGMLTAANSEIVRLQTEFTAADARYVTSLGSMQHSVSWRITRPLRGVRRLLRRR